MRSTQLSPPPPFFVSSRRCATASKVSGASVPADSLRSPSWRLEAVTPAFAAFSPTLRMD